MTMDYNLPTLTSKNLYLEDGFLKSYIKYTLPDDVFKKYKPFFNEVGKSASDSLPLAIEADKNEPQLLKFNILGELQNKILYHESYQRLRENSYGKGLISKKYEKNNLLVENKKYRHLIGFLSAFIFSKADTGIFCPICMTDSLALVLEKYLKNSKNTLVSESLEGLTTASVKNLFEGAMFLTERQGGSDVGENTVDAYEENGFWKIKGHKWFCSNADAEVALVLARMPGGASGTKGLGLFLLRKSKPENNFDTYEILRLKDKLGVKSMASGEINFNGTVVTLLAGENQGFKMMTEMINMSRLYNAVASLGVAKRAIEMINSWGTQRKAFGGKLADQPLWKVQVHELESEFKALFLMTFECIKLLDKSENGDAEAKTLSWLLTPVVKALCGKFGVFAASESMELIGGNAYIEEFGVAKLLRDAQVLPIWEGTTNIQSLDLLRILVKEEQALPILESLIIKDPDKKLNLYVQELKKEFKMSKTLDPQSLQKRSRHLVELLGRVFAYSLLQSHSKNLELSDNLKTFSQRESFTQYLGASVQ